MPIFLDCPCGRNYRVPNEHAGKKIRCRQCNNLLDVPTDDDVVDDVVAEKVPVVEAVTAAKPPRPRFPDEAPPPLPKRRKRRRRDYDDGGGGGFGISISPGIIGGALMMILAVIWFVLGLYFGWIFFYPPILFVIGLVRFVLSLFGQED